MSNSLYINSRENFLTLYLFFSFSKIIFFRELDNVLDSLKRSTNASWASPDSHLSNSVIYENDSDAFPSPSERDIVVKVRTRSGIKRFTMKTVSGVIYFAPTRLPKFLKKL